MEIVREFVAQSVEDEPQRLAVLREIDAVLREKSWGSIDQTGKVMAFEKEDEAMGGDAAREFYEYAKAIKNRRDKSHYQLLAERAQQLIEALGVTEPLVADLGTGPGELAQDIALQIPSSRVVGMDLSNDMLAMAKAGAAKAALQNRVSFLEMDVIDAPKYFEERGRKPDLVISRNMLHRVDDIQKFLLTFTEIAKAEGGIVYSVSFFNPQDFDLRGLDSFLKGMKARQQYPNLQKAWTLAYLNSPTLEKYEQAVQFVSGQVPIKNSRVAKDYSNYANIGFQRAG